jgi:hypothetical protein
MKNILLVFAIACSATFANAQRFGIEANRFLFKSNTSLSLPTELNTVGLSYSRKIIPVIGLHLAGSVNYGNNKLFGSPIKNGNYTENLEQASAQARVEWRPLYGFIVHPIIGYNVGYTMLTQNITSGNSRITSSEGSITKGPILGVGAKLFGIRFDLTSSLTKGDDLLVSSYQNNDANIDKAYKSIATPYIVRNYSLRMSFPLNSNDKKERSKMRN